MKLWKICDYTGLWKEGVIEFSLAIYIFLPDLIDPKCRYEMFVIVKFWTSTVEFAAFFYSAGFSSSKFYAISYEG